MLDRDNLIDFIQSEVGERVEECNLLTSRPESTVWDLKTAGHRYALRLSLNHEKLKRNYEILTQLIGNQIAPAPVKMGAYEECMWSLEEWIESVPGETKRGESGVSVKELMLIRVLLENFHQLGTDVRIKEIQKTIFLRYKPFFQNVVKCGCQHWIDWLIQHFPDADQTVEIHGACNLSNLVYVKDKPYLVDFCDGFPAEREMDVGSLYFAERCHFETLSEVFQDSKYNIKKILFYAILYGVKAYGKGRKEHEKYILNRLLLLKEEYEVVDR